MTLSPNPAVTPRQVSAFPLPGADQLAGVEATASPRAFIQRGAA